MDKKGKKVACGTFVLRANKEKPEKKLTAKLNGNLIALALHSLFELHP